ncbi:MAG TPA: substrate-binding domain-containing protein [Actinoplanes sp.]|nr:substrate-binding domain-containing protein [Actinoplanes sp.]
MRRGLFALVTAGLLALSGLTGCTSDGDGNSNGQKTGGPALVGVILPDTTSSPRWKTHDPRNLQRAFDEADVPVDIQNAFGDRARFEQIADDMIARGVKVLMIVSLDATSGAAVLAKARAANVKTIDYDRLTLDGGADYHVGFDNVEAGKLQGKGLVDCLEAGNAVNPVVAELNGPGTDNNATLLKQGYDSVLQPKYDEAEYTKGPDQDVTDWLSVEGAATFERMLKQQPKIGGVLAANDNLAAAVIGVLKKHGLNGKVPVAGQDATVEGLRNIITGDQCMTVYRAIGPEAQAAANLAIDLYHGWKPSPESLGLGGRAELGQIKDPESGAYIPFLGLKPELITMSNIQTLINDSFVFASELCAGEPYARLCLENGIL